MLIFPSSPVDQQLYTTGTIVYQYSTATTAWDRISSSVSISTQYVTSSTASTGTTTGALVVTGGVGIGGTLFVGNLRADATSSATSAAVFYNPVTKELTTSTAAAGGAAITIANDTSTAATYYVQLSSITSGTLTTSTVSSSKLYFTPNNGTLNATVFNSLSDITQKSNISVISNGLEIVESLRGVTFDWADGSGSSAGLLAQEVEQWLPQLVSVGPDGVKTLNYSGVIGALVEAVKTLSDRVKILESK